jgi:ribonuclease III
MAATEWNGRKEIGRGMVNHSSPGQIPVSLLDAGSPRPLDAVVAVFRPHVAPLPRATRGTPLPDWRSLEARLQLKFKNPTLLKQALIHTSYLNENPGIDVGSNERMEFLGDAALGVVVAQALYLEYPDVDEGTLTELRAHLVRRDTLARAAARLDLGDYLQLGRGEDAAGGRKRPTNLARAYEALVGAIFLDGGIARVRSFVKRSLGEELAGLRKSGMPYDPKSKLQELVQSRWQTTPSYKLLHTEGPDHARRFTVQVMVGGRSLGAGEGRSKQMAEKQAAQRALDEIDKSEGEPVVP